MKSFPSYITHLVAFIMEPAKLQGIRQECKGVCWMRMSSEMANEGKAIGHCTKGSWMMLVLECVCFLFSFFPLAMACHFLTLSVFLP